MDRTAFLTELQSNPGVIVIKYGAGWCAPCKKIQPYLDAKKKTFPPSWNYFELDVDTDTDLFAHLQAKKQVRNIPVLLAYRKGNLTPFSDLAVSGSDEKGLNAFFEGVKKL
jgi:thiol-disulfide isomerase/thioredoxin